MAQAIGVGLIGYGLGGRAFHAPYIAATPGMDLRAIVSRDPLKVRADFPTMQVVPTVAALLADPGIDLVIVSSPDALHAEHAIAALSAGKHVVVDKPFATSLSAAREIVEASERADRLLTVFHNRRWDADFLTLRSLIADGKLGIITEVESRLDRWRPAAAATWKEARQGGSWLDLGPHLVDQALVLFGRPLAVYADIATLRPGAPATDYFQAILRYPEMRVTLRSSKVVADHQLRFMVHGTGGSWVKHGIDPQEAATLAGRSPVGDDWGRDHQEGLFTRGKVNSTPQSIVNQQGNYRLFWQALVNAVSNRGPNPVLPPEALMVMEVLDAGLRSAKLRAEITL